MYLVPTTPNKDGRRRLDYPAGPIAMADRLPCRLDMSVVAGLLRLSVCEPMALVDPRSSRRPFYPVLSALRVSSYLYLLLWVT